MVTIETWRERMSEDMRLRDFRPRTQEGYLAATRQFIELLGRGPETATDKDVRDYFLYLREEKKLKVRATSRNLETSLKLIALAESL